MQLFERGSARMTAEYGIQVGRWEQYAGTEGKLPFGAMWSVVPPGGRTTEDCHPEQELAVVVSGEGEVESVATGDRRPVSGGIAALMDSSERHVWHNRSDEHPLVFLSIYWMPLPGAVDAAARDLATPRS
jgi:mannose-6-phosphate isomerase-like protein (cupin superfamily)